MLRRNKIGILICIITVSFALTLTNILPGKPKTIDLAVPVAADIQLAVIKMYQIQQDLVCRSDLGVSILDEILIDTSDYRPNLRELNAIQKFYGPSAILKAGYLTSQKAYYLSLKSKSVSTPEPGIKPTQPPVFYCPNPPVQITITFISIALIKDDRAVVVYDYGVGVLESILRRYQSGWMITSVQLIEYHGV